MPAVNVAPRSGINVPIIAPPDRGAEMLALLQQNRQQDDDALVIALLNVLAQQRGQKANLSQRESEFARTLTESQEARGAAENRAAERHEELMAKMAMSHKLAKSQVGLIKKQVEHEIKLGQSQQAQLDEDRETLRKMREAQAALLSLNDAQQKLDEQRDEEFLKAKQQHNEGIQDAMQAAKPLVGILDKLASGEELSLNEIDYFKRNAGALVGRVDKVFDPSRTDLDDAYRAGFGTTVSSILEPLRQENIASDIRGEELFQRHKASLTGVFSGAEPLRTAESARGSANALLSRVGALPKQYNRPGFLIREEQRIRDEFRPKSRAIRNVLEDVQGAILPGGDIFGKARKDIGDILAGREVGAQGEGVEPAVPALPVDVLDAGLPTGLSPAGRRFFGQQHIEPSLTTRPAPTTQPVSVRPIKPVGRIGARTREVDPFRDALRDVPSELDPLAELLVPMYP